MLLSILTVVVFGAPLAAAPLDARAGPDSPSRNYAPARVQCPSPRPTIRDADSLSTQEAMWLARRKQVVVRPMVGYLSRAGIPDFDASAFVEQIRSNASVLPTVAIALSGGGYRALLHGAGFLAAADTRTPNMTAGGGIGGLLQSSTYIAGLSGGAWLVGSLYMNNFSSVVSLRDGSPTSVTDYWGRALSYQLVNDTGGGPAYTFSSVTYGEAFIRAQIPFPILVANSRTPSSAASPLNSTVFEFNPYETGSWDPATYGFAPTRFLGSDFSGGVVPPAGSCVQGLDNAGFVVGTSSSLFNAFLLRNLTSAGNVPPAVAGAVASLLGADAVDEDVARWAPNPFFGFRPATNPAATARELHLVDGGEDLQNLPLYPLLQPQRAVDVIFAVDASADTDAGWPNATALRATYERSRGPLARGARFPAVPDAHTFVNLGLNRRPTFFGCRATASGWGPPDAPGPSPPVFPGPLVVYVPNAPYTAQTNASTFEASYARARRDDAIRNGLDAATQGNGSLDAAWPVCVACAVLSRSLARTATPAPIACRDCFARYCWDGALDPRDRGPYLPDFIIRNGTTVESPAGRAAAAVAWWAGTGLAAWCLL